MMAPFTTDTYLGKCYSHTYTCWDFACEVWTALTGKSLPIGHVDVSRPSAELHALAKQYAPAMSRLEAPRSPCVVLLQRKRINPHVGIYYQGKVLHLNPSGAVYESLHSVCARYTEVSYYA